MTSSRKPDLQASGGADYPLPVQPMSPSLAVRGISKSFANENGGLQVLESVSFSVYAGQFVCILGPSGCGKTTLLRILAGLLKPTSGEVHYQNQLLDGPRREFGFVFQKANLMPWRTVLSNILLPLEVHGAPGEAALRQAEAMVELVGLSGFENSLPRDLSGGMAQRVALGRALVHDPEVLLLDEPFGALDALTREIMSAELLRIWQVRQKTAILVTHSISEAILMADRVLVLSPRPGSLRLDLAISLPRPRHQDMRYTPEFGALARRLRAAIG
jgi:NitT/TauT family transport system ATP-binding protein